MFEGFLMLGALLSIGYLIAHKIYYSSNSYIETKRCKVLSKRKSSYMFKAVIIHEYELTLNNNEFVFILETNQNIYQQLIEGKTYDFKICFNKFGEPLSVKQVTEVLQL